MIVIISLIATILLIWFRTDAWLEYSKLLHLDKIANYKDFEKLKSNDVTLTYHLYLRLHHNNFFVRLITCPICFATWMGIIAGVIINPLTIPIIIVGSLLLFTTINRLLG